MGSLPPTLYTCMRIVQRATLTVAVATVTLSSQPSLPCAALLSYPRFKAYVRRIELDQWDTDAWTGLVKEAQNNRGGGMSLKDVLRYT